MVSSLGQLSYSRRLREAFDRVPRWLAAATIAVVAYVAALLFVFPKFFAPLSPFHTDFFDYVSKADLSGWDILISAPRPIAFFSMYVLGHLGVTGLLAAEIPIIIAAILLLRRYIELILHKRSTLWQFAVYTILLFSQQQFYFLYRHDLPFDVELCTLLIALLCWHSARGTFRYLLIFAALVFAFISCFSKETLYLAGPLLILFPSIVSRKWRANLIAAIVLLSIEFLCHLRAGLFAGSFDASSPYYVDFSFPGLLSRTIGYILLLMTPINTVALLLALVLTRTRYLALALIISGILAVVPNSALPNHIFEEYAWSAMPFLFSPILLEMRSVPELSKIFAPLIIVLALIFLGPKPTTGSAWMLTQEKITSNLYAGVASLSALPANATILILPPKDAPFAFWHSPSYVRHQFANHDALDILDTSKGMVQTQTDNTVRSGGIDDFDSRSISYVATFDDTGTLRSIEPVRKANCQLAEDAVIIPKLQSWLKNCSIDVPRPRDAAVAAKAFSDAGAWIALVDEARTFQTIKRYRKY